MTMTAERLAELDAVMAKATARDWYTGDDAAHPANVRIRSNQHPHIAKVYAADHVAPDQAERDATAIVALHNAYDDLRAHIDAQAATIAANTQREIHLTYVLKGLLGAYEAIVRLTGKDNLLGDDAPTWRNTARAALTGAA